MATNNAATDHYAELTNNPWILVLWATTVLAIFAT